ncbi:hypothetical protein PHACT_05715 [Pseudohongiella acticola]|uniref:Uncharacterized protein n=1 Tax=Pseudohongiella acticola TaxID=1524254 RepID=A0A1E8CJU7_9GAMM|nr:hypothetical protein PHACT_05715 [Pseudohongiella acticola]
MMNNVNTPQHIDCVLTAMAPVITEIVKHKSSQPQPGRHGQFAVRQHGPQSGVSQETHKPGRKPQRLAQHTRAQRRNGIVQTVVTGLAPQVHTQFNQQQQHEHRYGIQNKIHG